MAFRVMMFNYFFGSDTRSLGFLEIVNKKVPTIKVITLPHSPTGRGRKLKPNPVEVYCVNNNIAFEYYDSKETYKDMSMVVYLYLVITGILNEQNMHH